ncbi:leucine rich repeat (LRR) protein [Nonlabens dokdonensis]|uniref:Leucine rich repeat (LRR) protein n=2 Tax=Nonlabens dokdonensis TaxID=328515 RepID=A0ABX5PYX9_9FLAO|nr:leucine-rich repeat domain-containing protein [Nonlabens dokdonensis]AGC77186.1 putative Ras family [Nonlabens dokdonensis DSW-6]PZX41145.1 leucine rich repeat (LRR) protein [Nonlabens dokdonensis]
MEQKFELTESEELGYYTTFNKLFPAFLYQDSSEKVRTIQLNFQFTDEDTQPNEAQIAAHDYLLTHSNQMLENLVAYLKQDEEYFMEFYGVYREIDYEYTFNGKKHTSKSKNGFPAVEKAQDFINFLSITGINISSSNENGIAYIGFTGECPWDVEHGIGVSFHEKKLLHVGAWDYGYHPSWGSREDHDLLTNSFLKGHNLEQLDKRRKRLSTASELIQVSNSEEYDRLFDWLAKHQMIYGYRNSHVDLTSKEKIVVLKEIKELYLSGQNIQNIPDSLHLLENLISLEFWVNNLGIIPPQIFKLLKLENLSINNNQIKLVPEEIGLLKNLRSLNLSNNELNSIPDHISQLEKLEHLDLSGNQLYDLSVSILLLNRLKTLNLMNNNLSEINESIYELKKLERLDLRYNKLSKFPETIIDKWHSLNFIFLVGNQFSINALERIIRFNNRKINSDIEKELSFTKDKLIRELREEKNKLNIERRERQKQENLKYQEFNRAQSQSNLSDFKSDDKPETRWWEFWK